MAHLAVKWLAVKWLVLNDDYICISFKLFNFAE